MSQRAKSLEQALWRLFRRPERPVAWSRNAGNLPWNDPDFSARMLREHLDERHGAASRVKQERDLQIDWLWTHLGLQPGSRVLDFTCGPGLYAVALAERGCTVTGIDFSPASIAYARNRAKVQGQSDRCTFVEQDVRQWQAPAASFDAALFIYGQMAVFPPDEVPTLLARLAAALRPGGRLCLELLDPERIDKKNSTWWHTGEQGLWGERPYLHLGERYWDEATGCSTERFQIIHLESGQMDEIILSDQSYSSPQLQRLLDAVGFSQIAHYPAWDGLQLYDGAEWIVTIGEKGEERN